MIFYELAEAAFAVQDTFRGAEDVVAVWEESREIGGGVGGHVEDMPDVGDDGDGCPLESEA